MSKPPSDLKTAMTKGTKWSAIAQLSTGFFQFIVWVILARRMSAQDIGAISLTMVFFNLALLFNEMGIMSAIIQKPRIDNKHISTAFWLLVIAGSLLSVITIYLAPFAASFYKMPQLLGLITIFAIKMLIDSTITTHEALMQKSLRFKAIALIETTSSMVFGLTAIILVVNDFGPISLALGYLAKSTVKALMLTVYMPINIHSFIDKNSFSELFSFGRHIMGVKMLSFMEGNVDTLFIGKALGASSLGHYSLAMQVVNVPRHKLSRILSSVAFPAFSSIQNDISALRNAYLKLIRYAAAINIPILIGLLALSDNFIIAVYGEKWLNLALPMNILCFYGAAFSLTAFSSVVFNATGKPDYSLKLSIVSLFCAIFAILAGAHWGLNGICCGLSAYAIIINLVGAQLAKTILGYTDREYFASLMPSIFSSVIMFLTIKGFLLLFKKPDQSSLAVFFATIILGATTYLWALYCIHKRTFREIMVILKKMI